MLPQGESSETGTWRPGALSVCVRACQTDRAVRWRAVSLYRVRLCCYATTTARRSRSCAFAGSGPGSVDPGAAGCGGERKHALGMTEDYVYDANRIFGLLLIKLIRAKSQMCNSEGKSNSRGYISSKLIEVIG